MFNNEELVTDVTENVEEQATEELVDGAKVEEPISENEPIEPEKLYTEEDFNKKLDEVIGKKLARKEAKLRREYEDKYAADLELAYITKQGIGIEDSVEATNQMKNFYSNKNIDIKPFERSLSEREEELYAKALADDIISSGYEDLVEEVDRLADIGVNNMTQREKLIFTQLAAERKNQEAIKDLASIGVGRDVLEDKDFMDFSNKLNPTLSVKEKYEMYNKLKPKKQVEQIGSMKANVPNKVKDYYSPEEIGRLTEDDLDNPEIWEAVRRSMTK